MRARLAVPADATAIARIYNQGIEERTATFETRLRTPADVIAWFDGTHPVVVIVDSEGEGGAGQVIAFARASEYRPRECYQGVFEFAIYTAREARRRGAGLLVLRELIERSRAAGAWKLVSRVFVENQGSRTLLTSAGFREVGTYYRHGKLDGRWRDVVVVEKFLAPIGAETAAAPPRARSVGEILEALRSDVASERASALEWARFLAERDRRLDPEVLDAAMDAFFRAKNHDPTSRGQFVEIFRAWEDGAGLGLLVERLDQIPIDLDLDSFYEGAFVIKQLVLGGEARGAQSGGPPVELGPHRERLVEWLGHTIDLPSAMRTRISPGNVTALLLTLALAASTTEEERARVAALAAAARERHRVEPPTSLRASIPPPAAGSIPPLPPPPPATVIEEVEQAGHGLTVAKPITLPPPSPESTPNASTKPKKTRKVTTKAKTEKTGGSKDRRRRGKAKPE